MANTTEDTDPSPRQGIHPSTQKARVTHLENENKHLKKDLDKCRKDKLKADDAVAKAATEISVLRKNVGDLKNINAKLEKKIKTSKKIGKKFFSRKGKVDYKNDPMAKTIKDIVKSKIWRTIKFVDSLPELEKITRMALQYIDFEDQDDEDDDYLDKYVDRYMAAVCEALNEKKSYCQSEMKKVIFEYYDQNQKTIPTIEDIMKCSLRQIDSDHLKKLFCFYTDKLMPTVVGSEAWGKNIRHYTLLSEATIDDDGEEKQLITASSEAFLVILYENCHSKWIKWLEKLEKNPKYKFDRKDDDLKALYSDQDGGQKNLNGWKKAGLKRFLAIRKDIKAARKQAMEDQATVMETKKQAIADAKANNGDIEAAKALQGTCDFFQTEVDCLQMLHDANNLECKDADAEKKLRRKCKCDQEAEAEQANKSEEEQVETFDSDEE